MIHLPDIERRVVARGFGARVVDCHEEIAALMPGRRRLVFVWAYLDREQYAERLADERIHCIAVASRRPLGPLARRRIRMQLARRAAETFPAVAYV